MKVILHKLFPYAPYLNEYIGFEDEVWSTESPLEATVRLRKLAEQSHRERYPHLYQKGNESLIESWVSADPKYHNVINKEDERKAILLENINNSTTIEELKQYETPSMKYDLVQEYLNKKQSLLK